MYLEPTRPCFAWKKDLVLGGINTQQKRGKQKQQVPGPRNFKASFTSSIRASRRSNNNSLKRLLRGKAISCLANHPTFTALIPNSPASSRANRNCEELCYKKNSELSVFFVGDFMVFKAVDIFVWVVFVVSMVYNWTLTKILVLCCIHSRGWISKRMLVKQSGFHHVAQPQGGPLPVVCAVMTPISRVITSIAHV